MFETPVGIKYAVNVADLTKYVDEPMHPVNMMLVRVIDKSKVIVDAEPDNLDGAAVLISPETSTDQWNAIYSVMREGLGRHKGIGKGELRIYEYAGKGQPPYTMKMSGGSYGGTWKRI